MSSKTKTTSKSKAPKTSSALGAHLSDGADGARDFAGNRGGTRAHAINCVLLRAEKPLKTSEIDALAQKTPEGVAYTKETGRPVSAVSNHLIALERSGHVVRDSGGWRVLTQDEIKARDKKRAEEKAAAAAAAAKAKK